MLVLNTIDGETALEAEVTMDFGSGVSLNASSDPTVTSILGVSFSF